MKTRPAQIRVSSELCLPADHGIDSCKQLPGKGSMSERGRADELQGPHLRLPDPKLSAAQLCRPGLARRAFSSEIERHATRLPNRFLGVSGPEGRVTDGRPAVQKRCSAY